MVLERDFGKVHGYGLNHISVSRYDRWVFTSDRQGHLKQWSDPAFHYFEWHYLKNIEDLLGNKWHLLQGGFFPEVHQPVVPDLPAPGA